MKSSTAHDQEAVIAAFRASVEACVAHDKHQLELAVRRRDAHLAGLSPEQVRLFEMATTIGQRADDIRRTRTKAA